MGPLTGLTILEIASIGPGPFAAMMMADMGARVIRIDRPGGNPTTPGDPRRDMLNRGRTSLALDLKSSRGRDTLLRLAAQADGLMEGFRPGVMERMGLGPEDLQARNPRLVYGRMTGWGQTGPLAGAAGHDIDYIALTGALAAIGRAGQPPSVPLNLIGDFGGGAMYLAFGMVCALYEARGSGQGQVVDAAMVDGVNSLMTIVHSLDGIGLWRPERGANLLDSGAPFYDVYETADAGYLAVGPLEPQFFREFIELAGLADNPAGRQQFDPAGWPAMRDAIAEAIAGRTRAEWEDIFAGSNACVAPVLDYRDARSHPHMQARGAFVERDGMTQPAPAPRLSRTPGEIAGSPPRPGEHSRDVLESFGFSPDEIADILDE